VSVIGFLLVTAAIAARGGYRETALAQMSEGVRRPVAFSIRNASSVTSQPLNPPYVLVSQISGRGASLLWWSM